MFHSAFGDEVNPYVYVLWLIFGNSLVVVDFKDVVEVLGEDDGAWRGFSTYCKNFATVISGDFYSRNEDVPRFYKLLSTLPNLLVDFKSMIFCLDKKICLPLHNVPWQLPRTTIVWDESMNSTLEVEKLRKVLGVLDNQKILFKPRWSSSSNDIHTYTTRFNTAPQHGVEYFPTLIGIGR